MLKTDEHTQSLVVLWNGQRFMPSEPGVIEFCEHRH